jgi:hypothetical protein
MDEKITKVKTYLELMRADNFIVVNKRLAVNIGLTPSVIFYELASKYNYFESKNELRSFYNKKENKHYENYFFCTIEDLQENTGLSRGEQDTAINKLVKLGLIDKQLKKLKGDDGPRRYFKITATDVLIEKYLKPKSSKEETVNVKNNHQNTPVNTENTGFVENCKTTCDFLQNDLQFSTPNKTNNKTKYKTKNTNNNYRENFHNCNNMELKNKNPVVGVQKPNEEININQKNEMNPIEILELKELFQEKTKKEVSESYIKNLLKAYGYENIFKVLNKFKKIRPANQIENIYGFINNAVKAEYSGKPYTENTSVEAIERKKEGYKPVQSTNFEQREYDDEFFDSLYDNY